MAYLAVNKDGTEIISDYSLYRSGYYKRYKKCDPVLCDKCASNRIICSLPLTFPTKEMAADFLDCFTDLCEVAKIII